jgi:hypothetical protein
MTPWFKIDRICPPDEVSCYIRTTFGYDDLAATISMLPDTHHKLSEIRKHKKSLKLRLGELIKDMEQREDSGTNTLEQG